MREGYKQTIHYQLFLIRQLPAALGAKLTTDKYVRLSLVFFAKSFHHRVVLCFLGKVYMFVCICVCVCLGGCVWCVQICESLQKQRKLVSSRQQLIDGPAGCGAKLHHSRIFNHEN